MTRGTLAADRIRAAELDAQILDPEHSLSALRAQRALVQERLDSVRYPVLTLPNELVSEIFVHFLPIYPACPPLTGILSPTNLTHICRKWREVARTNPMLWRAIRLRLNALPRQAQAFHMYLSMSGSCPFSIETEADPSEWLDISVKELATNILAVLIPHRARWEHLQLNHVTLPHCFLEQHPMPLLRHLALQSLGTTEEDSDPLLLGEAPLLRSVILTGYVANTFVLPWAQLTSVTLFSVYLHECAPVLRQTANLTYCRLYPIFSYQDELEPDVTLSRLESLILDPSEHIPGFLEIFVAPALRYFEISEKTLGFNPIHSLTSFISKSACKLQEARIMGDRSVTAEAYMRAFPSVEFSFDGQYFGEGIDVAMDSEASSSDPELESGSDGE